MLLMKAACCQNIEIVLHPTILSHIYIYIYISVWCFLLRIYDCFAMDVFFMYGYVSGYMLLLLWLDISVCIM